MDKRKIKKLLILNLPYFLVGLFATNESTLSGLLPERQGQRMIQQYDEEQILLERRVAELENLVQQDEIKQVDASRFIALVKKYRDCEELTDTMLYLDSLQAEYDKLKATHTELAGQLATAKEELQPMKDIRYWVSKVLTPEQSEVEKKPEPKHSVTEKMKYLQEQSNHQPEQKTPQQKKQNMEL